MSFFIFIVDFFMYYFYYVKIVKQNENLKSMKKIIYLTLILNLFIFAGDGDELINIGDISFEDMNWNKYDDIFYSRKNIQEITSQGKAVVIHFFYACLS